MTGAEACTIGQRHFDMGDYAKAMTWFMRGAETGEPASLNNVGYCYQHGRGVTQDLTIAVQWYIRAAESGSAAGMNNLGYCYQHGRGILADHAQAVQWYRASAEMGNAAAMCNLAACLEKAIGLPNSDPVEAVQWYKKAADVGSTSAVFHFGRCLRDGIGMKVDLARAVACFRRGASKQNGQCMAALGDCYRDGVGVHVSIGQAVSWYHKAVEKQDAGAMVSLGQLLVKASPKSSAKARKRNCTEALRLYRQAADRGNAVAIRVLGDCYRTGNDALEADAAIAVPLYRKAGEKGDLPAMYELAQSYKYGRGVARDDVEAFAWFQRAADGGHAPAMTALAECYAQGVGVRVRDDSAAFSWYSKAARLGDYAAMAGLGQSYLDGRGTARDPVEAIRWLSVAADHRNGAGMAALSSCYRSGEGLAPDWERAAFWAQAAANIGVPAGFALLGEFHEMGIGVPQNLDKALEHYRMAADGGDTTAMMRLGNFAFNGLRQEHNYASALEWYRKAAARGCAAAMTSVGDCYMHGLGTPAADPAEAVRWYSKAADAGDVGAMCLLGECYQEGRGTAPNQVQAMAWYQQAANRGSTSAKVVVAELYETGLGVERDFDAAVRLYVEAADADDSNALLALARPDLAQLIDRSWRRHHPTLDLAGRVADRRARREFETTKNRLEAEWKAQLPDLEHCPACLEAFSSSRPAYLSGTCLHAVCKPCSVTFISDVDGMLCPTCNKTSSVITTSATTVAGAELGPDRLPVLVEDGGASSDAGEGTASTAPPPRSSTAWALQLHPIVQAKLAAAANSRCDKCKLDHALDEPAVAFCPQCNQHLCQQHGPELHRRLPTHKVVAVPSVAVGRVCRAHGRPVEAHCKGCEQLLCGAACMLAHPAPQHVVTLIEDGADAARQRLRSAIMTARRAAEVSLDRGADGWVNLVDLRLPARALAPPFRATGALEPREGTGMLAGIALNKVHQAFTTLESLLQARWTSALDGIAAWALEEAAKVETGIEADRQRWLFLTFMIDMANELLSDRLGAIAASVLAELEPRLTQQLHALVASVPAVPVEFPHEFVVELAGPLTSPALFRDHVHTTSWPST